MPFIFLHLIFFFHITLYTLEYTFHIHMLHFFCFLLLLRLRREMVAFAI
jgi:hypothetical protein